jgi:nucleoside-diphosphate-sugar epimerase
MKKILVTGASGFIGNFVCKNLLRLGRSVSASVRTDDLIPLNTNIKYFSVGEINNRTNWKEALIDTNCVIHCAGRTHFMNKINANEIKNFNSVNVDGVKQLAEQAAKAGVEKLIFLSSIKVNGENTFNKNNKVHLNQKNKYLFTTNDIANPKDAYAASKLKAENILWEISSKTNLEIVVVRLPLVYGCGVKGNLARLIKLIKFGIPLPLSNVQNKRSMLGIENLVDLLIRCIDYPNANGKTFLASDGEDLSTPELIKLIASSMKKKANLFPIPLFLHKFLGSIFGKSEEINRLTGSLRVDNSYTKEILNWSPPLSVEEGIRKMVQGK